MFSRRFPTGRGTQAQLRSLAWPVLCEGTLRLRAGAGAQVEMKEQPDTPGSPVEGRLSSLRQGRHTADSLRPRGRGANVRAAVAQRALSAEGTRVQHFLGSDLRGLGAQCCFQTKSDPAAPGKPHAGGHTGGFSVVLPLFAERGCTGCLSPGRGRNPFPPPGRALSAF